MSRGYVLLGFLGALLLGYLVGNSTFISDRCEEEDPVLKGIVSRAFDGDVSAISFLYSKYKQEGVDSLTQFWLFRGALAGDIVLRNKYVSEFRRLSQDQRERDIKIIKQAPATKGNLCLLALLEGQGNAQSLCAGTI